MGQATKRTIDLPGESVDIQLRKIDIESVAKCGVDLRKRRAALFARRELRDFNLGVTEQDF